MDKKIALFTVLAFAAVFAMFAPMDSVAAQTTDAMPDGEDGEHEGKTCPFKKEKSASVSASFDI